VWQENILKELGLLSYIDAVVTSHSVGVEKPNQGIFQAALDRVNVGHHQAADCLHIGDNLVNDFHGPKVSICSPSNYIIQTNYDRIGVPDAIQTASARRPQEQERCSSVRPN